MNTIEIYFRKKTGEAVHKRYSGPSCWKELSEAQQVALMRVRAKANSQQEVLFAALKVVYGIKPKLQQWLFDERFLYHQGVGDDERALFLEHGQNVLDTLGWIGEEDREAGFMAKFRRFDFHYGTPLILIKRFVDRRVYAGPQAGLGNCTFAEFMFADKAYRDGNLPKLAAILYRPLYKLDHDARDECGRQAFDRKSVEKRTIQFERLDSAILERIGFSFGCTMLLLQRMFTYVFPPQLIPDGEPAPKAKKPQGNWLDVAIGMAKLDVIKVPIIETQNLYLVLKVLNEQLKQHEKMEQEIEKIKTKK